MNDALFRPSSLLRRQLCPGSLALESTIPDAPDEEANQDAQEGRLLHRLIADPSLSREGLTPEQHDALLKGESMETELFRVVAS